MEYYFVMLISAVLVNNFVLSKFLGICPFLGVSKRTETALGMGGAVIFVMTLSSFITALIYRTLLNQNFVLFGQTFNFSFLKILIFIVVIAALVQMVEICLRKFSPKLYDALGIFLPLITTNCAVLGAAELCVKNDLGIIDSTAFSLFSAIGFALALILFSSLREKLELARVPLPFQGLPVALVTAGILAMAFMAFKNLVTA